MTSRLIHRSLPSALLPLKRLSCPSTLASRQQRSFSAKSSALNSILRQVEEGKLSAVEAEKEILNADTSAHMTRNKNVSSTSPQDEILQSFANLDHKRSVRTGFPEAIFAQGKTAKQVAAILDDMAHHVNTAVDNKESGIGLANNAILATRVDKEQWEEIERIPLQNGTLTYHEVARIVSMEASSLESINTIVNDEAKKKVVVACAGTTDLSVAEEAAVTLEMAGCDVDRVYDVGVAGLHRIIGALPRLRDPSVKCIIVCAGMDGALPSVVGGLVSVPVLAAPTSVGYGASFGGVSALLTMLNSCAPGVGVVNIDNGFGAAALAFKIM